ncbi:hypothetical protein LY39_03299 [Roseinatronobacter bogoriensis subsp. barguzinensis]|nr:hypothetical protein [Rhodobaca bogoriensis DSM 18756]TDW35204.1 hypothetical protein LY39_03299 [Rhodobaca barguzinensis]TDY66786.1 hypothetical protein EV660_10910 [Rhodobaca bogoriensis DSM 18756]
MHRSAETGARAGAKLRTFQGFFGNRGRISLPARSSGGRGRRFESSHSDQFKKRIFPKRVHETAQRSRVELLRG